MSYKVDWHRIPETVVPKNTFKPLWIMTNEGVRMGRYIGGDATLKESWVSGHFFDVATHWAYVIEPDAPDGTEDKPYEVVRD